MKQLDPMVVGQQLFSNLGHIHTVKYSELTGVHSVMNCYGICNLYAFYSAETSRDK